MIGKCFVITKATTGLALAALLLIVGQSHAQQNSLVFPWQAQGYQGYNEPQHVTQPVLTDATPAKPSKYQVYTTTLPEKSTEDPNIATVMAHVPANAKIWLDGKLTTSTGDLRTYSSPALTTGWKYTYTVRVDWIEEGKQVSQTPDFPVKACGIHCVYVIRSDSKLDPTKEVVETNLSKLTPEDRKLAHAQKFCAVQNGVRLGATGVPVKIMVNDQPVMLCCEACHARAEKNAEKTLAKVKELKGKSTTSSDK